MSSICGFWQMVDSSKDLTSVELMTTKLNHWNADKIGHWTKKSLGFGHLMLYNTPESLTESLPFVTSHNKLCITADARIDNRSTLSKEFNLTINSTINKPDSWFILEAYKKWGSNCASKLEGDFAFAIWDAEKNKIYCARDQIGIKPFYYYFNNGIFAFATEMKGITALKEVDNSLNTQWISDYVLNIRANRKYTFYKHINRLEAAHQICVETDTLKIKKYWELNTQSKLILATENDYITAFRKKLDQAIAKRLRSNWAISSELSGGLDSSVIVATAKVILAKTERQITTISDVMPFPIPIKDPALIDERSRINNFLQFAKVKKFHFVTGEEKTIVDSLDRAIKIHDEPPTKFINVTADLIYEKTQEINSRVLLSGHGGDDIVSNKGSFFYEDLFFSRKWRTLWTEIKSRKSHQKTPNFIKLLGVIKSILNLTLPSISNYVDKKIFYRESFVALKEKIWTASMNPTHYEKQEVEKRFFNHRKLDYRKKSMNEVIAARIIHPIMLHYRLEYCNLSAAHNKVEIRYPLFDLPLIEFYMSIPTTMKVKLGVNRYIYRQVAKELITEEIRTLPTKHSSSSPSHIWRKFRDKKLSIEILKKLPKESLVNEYIDRDTYIERMEKLIAKKDYTNYGGKRLYLLQKKLDEHILNNQKFISE